MFNYIKNRLLISDIIDILKIDYGLNSYPSLVFEYTLNNKLLILKLPSKDQYLLSRLKKEMTITYNHLNESVLMSDESLNISSNKRLLRHLKKCFKFLQKREEFNNSILELHKKMSKYIVNNKNTKNNKKESIIENLLFYISSDSDSSHVDDYSSSHNDTSHHHD